MLRVRMQKGRREEREAPEGQRRRLRGVDPQQPEDLGRGEVAHR